MTSARLISYIFMKNRGHTLYSIRFIVGLIVMREILYLILKQAIKYACLH